MFCSLSVNQLVELVTLLSRGLILYPVNWKYGFVYLQRCVFIGSREYVVVYDGGVFTGIWSMLQCCEL
jgi:hypothetical protein